MHGRPRNARWSRERDGRAQHHFRKALIARSGGICERCAVRAGRVAHHDRPGYDAECGRWLCDECHQAVDNHARAS